MKRFEYKILIGKEKVLAGVLGGGDEPLLNDSGNEGWELVSVIYPVHPAKSVDRKMGERAALYHLKREIPEEN